jgi:hypothetical protein
VTFHRGQNVKDAEWKNKPEKKNARAQILIHLSMSVLMLKQQKHV